MALSLYQLADAMLGCVCTSLGAQEPPWEGECCVVPGKVTLDKCTEKGGQAWARFVEVYPTASFPRRDDTIDPSECPTVRWAAVFEVGVSRGVCYDACNCDMKQLNATRVMGDAEALLKGILCCFAFSGPCVNYEFRILRTEPYGPEVSGCAGTKITVAIEYRVCCDAEPESP